MFRSFQKNTSVCLQLGILFISVGIWNQFYIDIFPITFDMLNLAAVFIFACRFAYYDSLYKSGELMGAMGATGEQGPRGFTFPFKT